MARLGRPLVQICRPRGVFSAGAEANALIECGRPRRELSARAMVELYEASTREPEPLAVAGSMCSRSIG
jgi:hypothetical protein